MKTTTTVMTKRKLQLRNLTTTTEKTQTIKKTTTTVATKRKQQLQNLTTTEKNSDHQKGNNNINCKEPNYGNYGIEDSSEGDGSHNNDNDKDENDEDDEDVAESQALFLSIYL